MKKNKNQESREKGFGSVIEREADMLATQLERIAQELRERNSEAHVFAMFREDLSIEVTYTKTSKDDEEPELLLLTTVSELVDMEIDSYVDKHLVVDEGAAHITALRNDLLNNAIRLDKCLGKDQQILTSFK